MTKKYGLIGKKLGHSFSPAYFSKKFARASLFDHSYTTFELDHIEEVTKVLSEGLLGANVTIPYKKAILTYLHGLDEAAKDIGAVNCIVNINGQYKGYNTDWLGFRQSLVEFIGDQRPEALVLGNGGASKAICYALEHLQIKYMVISRSEKGLRYEDLTPAIIASNHLIINTTPLGMYPFVDDFPQIPYDGIDDQHFVFDLIYNPEKTLFLALSAERGAKIQNGYPMLVYQAEESWKLWNS
ncbi:MAG: shikimate dehydrogenase [Saprospiraceae bacterium]|nr:shikimate dehydrogenase [Saprospiraceae bacterium]